MDFGLKICKAAQPLATFLVEFIGNPERKRRLKTVQAGKFCIFHLGRCGCALTFAGVCLREAFSVSILGFSRSPETHSRRRRLRTSRIADPGHISRSTLISRRSSIEATEECLCGADDVSTGKFSFDQGPGRASHTLSFGGVVDQCRERFSEGLRVAWGH